MPIEQTAVKMVSEKVTMTGNQIDNQGRWQFNCDYVFQNTTAKPLQFLMGFPFPVYDDMAEYAIPVGIHVKSGDPLLYEFKAAIDGKPITAQATKLSPNTFKQLDYHDAYQWSVNFKPHQTLNITHAYITGVTTNALAETWVRFVLKTGGLWQSGIIGNAQLTVKPNTPTRLCSPIPGVGLADTYAPTPAGMKIIADGKLQTYVWNLNQLRPTQDLSLCLVTANRFVLNTVINSILYDQHAKQTLEKKSCSTLKQLRNTIYAQYGKSFDEHALQQYFNQQWWYQPNANYSEKSLTLSDKQVLKMIMQVESGKGCG
jgi:hypothetical protein